MESYLLFHFNLRFQCPNSLRFLFPLHYHLYVQPKHYDHALPFSDVGAAFAPMLDAIRPAWSRELLTATGPGLVGFHDRQVVFLTQRPPDITW
jgi:hypothetical protein